MTCQTLQCTVLRRHLLERLGQENGLFVLYFIASGDKCQPPVLLNNSSQDISICSSRKYSTITALEQRQQYKDDFCAEYDEYRALHDRIGTITEMFVQLGSKINTLSPGTQEYKVLSGPRNRSLLRFQHNTLCKQRTAQIHNSLTLFSFNPSSLWRTKYYRSTESIRK